jgi:four helix bundle protein
MPRVQELQRSRGLTLASFAISQGRNSRFTRDRSESASVIRLHWIRCMAAFKKFEEIIAWQLSTQLKIQVDEFLNRPDFKRRFKLVDQLSDAARSAPRNIAEGHMRGFKHKEFAQFLRIARGSLGEVLNHLLDAHQQRLISDGELFSTERIAKRAIKATTKLMQYLESTPDPKSPTAP